MHYYFDVLVNLDETLWEFYEWEQNDNLVPIKKVPLIRVKEKDIENFMKYQVTFDETWLEKYIDKTTLKNQKEKITCLLFSSTKNNILLELNKKGEVIGKSKLLIEDDNNCNEMSFTEKETNISYEIGPKIKVEKEFRQAKKEKKLIEIELETIKKTNNIKKCSYLYYEWFGGFETNLEKMILEMKEELKKDYTLKLHEISLLIKMSYKEQL